MKHPEILQQEAGAVAGNSEMTVRYEGEDMQLSRQDNPLQGKHNQYNSMAAGISARAAGIRQASIRESFKTFEGLEHRLEDLGYANGVHFINDSKATNMNSVWYALESMKAPVVLILGGHDKGNDYNEIADLVQEKVKAIVCLGVNNEPIISFFGHTINDIIETQSAATAVEAARSLSAPGDVVLLSPGCSSYDLFVDYQDRGNQFKAAVKQLKD